MKKTIGMILILMLVFTTSAYAITFTVVEKVDISNIMKITTEKLTELKDSVLDNFPDAKKGAWLAVAWPREPWELPRPSGWSGSLLQQLRSPAATATMMLR